MSSYLLDVPNHAFCAFTAAPELKFHIFDPRDKIVQNINFLPINKNSYSRSKLNRIGQHECRDILGFQNRASDIKLLKFYANQDNIVYIRKYDFQRKLVYQF